MTSLFRVFFLVLFLCASLHVSAQTLTLQSFGSPSQTDALLSSNVYALSRGGVMDIHEASGISVYVWAEPDLISSPSGNRNINCIIYDKNMNVLQPAFLVNTNTSGDQYQPAIEINQLENTFIVAWASNHGTDGQYDIYAKKINLYEQNTAIVATQTDNVINSNYTTLRQLTPKIAFDYAFDEVIIAWRDADGQDGSGTGVYARRFSNTNFPTAADNQFLVNQVTTDNQVLYEIEVSPVTGAFYASYSSIISSYYDVLTRRFNRNTDGTFTAVSEVKANTTTTLAQYNPVFAFNKSNGNYTISWTSDSQDGSGRGIYFRVYDKTDAALTAEIRGSIPTTNDQYNIRTAWDEESGFLMHAYSYTNGSTTNIKYQLFDNSYATSGSETDAISSTNLVYNQCYFALSYDQTNKAFRLCYQLYTTGTDLGKTYARYFAYSHPSYAAPACSTDNSKNWTSYAVYDQNGNKVQEQRTYSDQLGRTIQVQARDFENKNTLATATLYDKQGLPAIQTLPATTNSQCLNFKNDLVSFYDGSSYVPYTFNNFDNASGTGAWNNPQAVAANTGVGQYYSSSNTAEPYVPISSYPYSRFYANNAVAGGVVKSANSGEALKMGSGKEKKSFIAPILNELDHYMTLRNNFFVSGGSTQSSLAYQGTKTFQVDENGVISVSFKDKSGKPLAKALIDGSQVTPVTGNIAPSSFYYWNLSNNTGANMSLYINNPQESVEGYNFTTSSTISISSFDTPLIIPNGQTIQLRSLGSFNINVVTFSNSFISYPSYYARPSLPSALDMYVQYTAGLIVTGGADDKILVTNLETGAIVYSGFLSGFTTVPSSGFYRFRLQSYAFSSAYSATQSFSISSNTALTNFSYNFYDNAGNMVAEVAPNSLVPVSPNGILSVATTSPVNKTTYGFNTKGAILFKNDLDGGLTNYVYRKDGSLRFSQNGLQAFTGNFNYTNYDISGRVIETGEYDRSKGGTAVFMTHQYFATSPTGFQYCVHNILEATDIYGGLDGITSLTQRSKITYDIISSSLPVAPTNIPYNRSQAFTTGRTSISSNDNNTTWYSYDELGRTKWTIQNIVGLGYKTTDYVYDLNGNILKVIYQDATTERFEHRYTYDKNQRLKLVETKAGNGARAYQLEEKSSYYLHGPLKRKEIAGDLQGIDYTYTIQGWLKSINNPQLDSNDPGVDGYTGTHSGFSKDVFGELLEYYSLDADYLGDYGMYGRCTKGINNAFHYNATTNKFDGTVMAMRWQTRGHDISGSSLEYLFEYDKKYQLTNANFATVSLNNASACSTPGVAPYYISVPSNNYQVSLTYDANGNILTKNTKDQAGAISESFTYAYPFTSKNRLGSVYNTTTSTNYAVYSNYNEIGQLTEETKGTKVNAISYNVYGLTAKVVETSSGTNKVQIELAYNELGYRIKKKSYNSIGTLLYTTYYVNDINGKVLSIYDDNGTSLSQKELPIYGSGRIGIAYKTSVYTYNYELTDHLGNVRAVINRTKVSGQADIFSWQDYYPHGGAMPTRKGNTYRSDYQGQFAEKDAETGYNAFELRMYDANIGRWLSADPMGQYWSPYMAMGNNPVSFIDPTGGDDYAGGMGGGAANGGGPSGMPALYGMPSWYYGGDWSAMDPERYTFSREVTGTSLLGSIIRLFDSEAGIRRGDLSGNRDGVLFDLYEVTRTVEESTWMFYNGTNLTFYQGEFGDKSSKLIRSYSGSSGLISGNSDYRNSKYQYEKDKGPIPQGKYTLNLEPDPERDAKWNSQGKLIPSKDGGIEKIPLTSDSNGNRYAQPGWGNYRAALTPDKDTDVRGRTSFYIHDSAKRFTHGCIEVPSGVIGTLKAARRYQSTMRLLVEYETTDTPTDGGFPRP